MSPPETPGSEDQDTAAQSAAAARTEDAGDGSEDRRDGDTGGTGAETGSKDAGDEPETARTKQPEPAPEKKSESSAGQVRVVMTGFRNDKGKAMVALFTNKQHFPRKGKRAAHKTGVRIQNGRATAIIKGVKPGTFAVAILHDENLNREMDENFVGMPEEGFGFSRNPEIGMGPPSWNESALRLAPGKKVRVEIKLKYL